MLPIFNYERLDGYIRKLSENVYPEPSMDYHKGLTDVAIGFYIRPQNFKKCLDVGCGTGYALDRFAEMGIEATGITLAEQEATRPNVRVMFMESLDFPDESFDLVWCRHALEHSVMPMIALLEFKRVLTDDGNVYIEVPSSNGIHLGNADHYSMLGDEAWQSIFAKAGLEVLHRGQATIFLPDDYRDYYWRYWLKKA